MNEARVLFYVIGMLLWPVGFILLFVLIFRMFFGRRRGFNKGLLHELPIWEGKGIISRQQGDDILSLYELKRVEGRPRMDMVKFLTVIGALFIGIGVIFFVASNWQKIPAMVKTGMLLAVTIFTLYMGYLFTCEKKGFQNLGKSLLFLSCLFWGGSIALIGQIYNVPVSDNWYIMWLWALPILPVAIVFGNVYIYVLSSVLFLIWNFLYKSTHTPNYLYPLIVFAVLLPFGADSKAVRRINVLGLIIAAIVCCFLKFEWVALLISAGLLGYGYFKKEEPVYLRAATISFLCWAITFFIVRNDFPNVFFILPLWMLLRISRENDDMPNVALTLFCGLVWFGMLFHSCSKLWDFDYNFVMLQMAVGLAIYLIGIFLKLKNIASYYVYKIFGYLVGFIFIYVAAFESVASYLDTALSPLFTKILMFLLTLILLGILAAGKRDYFREKSHRFELAGMGLMIAAMATFIFYGHKVTLVVFIANAVLFLFALINMFMGMEIQRPALFNAGVIIFAILIVTRFVDIGWKLKEKSLFFIIGGILLMGLGIFFENKRRKIIERMRG